MTAIISLVRRDDFTSDIDNINLTGYGNEFELADNGWAQAIQVPSDTSVVESFTFRVKGTSQNDLAANIQAFDKKLLQVTYWNDPNEIYGVWLRTKLLNESNNRQSLVLSAKRSPVKLMSHFANVNNGVDLYGLALERMPWWESDSAVTITAASMASVAGISSAYSAVVGNMAARLALVQFQGVNAGGGPLNKFWLGFRSDRWGTPANFVPNWNLPLGTIGGTGADTTVVAGDATAKAGAHLKTTFQGSLPSGGPTMVQRVTVTVGTVAASNPNDQRGTFLVLLRAKLEAAGTVNVRLVDGLFNLTNGFVHARVPISSTTWQMYEMGTVHIPSPGRLINGSLLVSTYSIAVQAELIQGVAGTANLDLDCLVLIPVDDGWLSADMNQNLLGVLYNGGDLQPLYVMNRPDGKTDCVWMATSVPQMPAATRLSGGLPIGTGVMVMAAQRYQASTLGDVATVVVSAYPRWDTLRGAS